LLIEQIKTQLGLTSDSLTRKFAHFLKPQNYDYIVFYPPYNKLYTADITPSKDLKERLRQINEQKPKISFFFAIPWCRQKCPYCIYHCNVEHRLSENDQRDYLDSLIQEFKLYLKHLKQSSVDTIYIGGGTPSLLKPSLLEHFIESLSCAIGQNGKSLDDLAELNFEIHPNDKHKELLPILKRYVSPHQLRISLGAQSFFDERIENIRGKKGKTYKGMDVVNAFKFLDEQNVKTNLDLMWGLSGKNISDELDFIKNKGIYPTTFTFYQIQSPGDIKRDKNYIKNIEKDTLKILRQRKEIFNTLVDSYGYEPILFPAYFQKNKDGAIYNTKQMAENCYYIGLGVSGHSKLIRWAYRNTDDIKRYIKLVTALKFPIDYVTKLSSDKEVKKRDNLLRMRLPDQTFQEEDLTDLFRDTTDENDRKELRETFFVKGSENYELNRKGKIFVDEIIRCAIKNDVSLMARFDKRIISTYQVRNKTERNDIKIENILSFMKNAVGQILVQEANIKKFVANIAYTSDILNRLFNKDGRDGLFTIFHDDPVGLINYEKKWHHALKRFNELHGDKLYYFGELFQSLNDIGVAYPLIIEGDDFMSDSEQKIYERLLDAIKNVDSLKCLEGRYKKAQDKNKTDTFFAMNKLFHCYVEEIKSTADDEKVYLYFLISRSTKTSTGGAVVALCFKDPDDAETLKLLDNLSRYLEEVFALISESEFMEELTHYALRSAISAIMSRNMSHNIGSHILINLEKNGNGTDVDDIKQFLSYLRARMDFLAQISTDWPSWSLPTRFLQDLMCDYFQQICLLRYIGTSENLNDKKLKMFFYFDDKQVLGPCNPSDKTKLEKLKKNLLEKDIWISVVGGVTGRQAFYVMLENIIRNAAKHSYSGTGDLEIHINIKAEENEYRIEIWDNVSENKNGLLAKINKAIEQSIITEIGEVQKGNWGIAEIKICAAYLQKFDYKLFDHQRENNKKIIRAETTDDGYLKYVFHLPMPRDVAIVDMRGEEVQLPDPEGNSIVLRKTVDEFALMDIVDTDYEFMVLFPDVASTEDVLKKLADNKSILLERLATRLFWVGDKTAFNKATDSCPYIRKRIAVLDSNDIKKKLEESEFRLWLYVEWIKHLRDNVRGDDIVKDKKFHLYLKLTEEVGANQYNSDYIKDYYSYFIPPLVQISNNFDSDTKNQWQRLKNTVESKSGSILSEIIEDVLIHENVPKDGLPIIAYPRHGPSKNAELKNLVSDKRLIYAEELSGASPHFNILASPPTDDYQLKKLALWLIEGGLLRIAIADERIGKEIGDNLERWSIINIAKLIRNDDIKTPVSVSSAGQYISVSDKYPYVSKITSRAKNPPLIADVFVIHQGVIDKMVNAKFWDSMDDAENWILRLKEQVPFIIVTSGRGKPDEIPDGVKYVPFSDISQSFAGKHSTKLLLTYILMHARE